MCADCVGVAGQGGACLWDGLVFLICTAFCVAWYYVWKALSKYIFLATSVQISMAQHWGNDAFVQNSIVEFFFILVGCNIFVIFLLSATANESVFQPVWHRDDISLESEALHVLCPCSSTHNPFICLFHYLNFSRGKGPLKNSSDVINAAKKIAEAGSRMDKLARAVADQVAMQLL